MSTQIARAHPRPRLVTVLVVIGLAIALSALALQAQAIFSGTNEARSTTVSSIGDVSLSRSLHWPGPHRGQVRFGRLPATKATAIRPHGPKHRPKWGA